jgi:hypothetical protein
MRPKKLLFACLTACLLLTGCTLHYDISTFNGNIIRAATKPALDESGRDYVFKDSLGQEVRINRLKVRKIEPVNPGDPPARSFD